jgi:hypothetical protein
MEKNTAKNMTKKALTRFNRSRNGMKNLLEGLSCAVSVI